MQFMSNYILSNWGNFYLQRRLKSIAVFVEGSFYCRTLYTATTW